MGFISGAPQRGSLPCGFYTTHGKEKTHGKQALCRAPERKRTAKILFAVRFLHDGRQIFFLSPTLQINEASFLLKKTNLSCARKKTHNKDLVCRAFSPRCTANHF
jgi:hypothetical protein